MVSDSNTQSIGTAEQANEVLKEAGFHVPFFNGKERDGTETHIMDRHQTGEDVQFFEMDFAFENQQVYLNMCRAYLITVPVEHTIHNRIDTKDLETRMKQINWAHDYNRGDFFDRVDPDTRDRLYPQVKSVYDDLNQLTQGGANPGGIRLADQLMVKYWSWTPENDYSLYLEKAKEQYMVQKDYLHIPSLGDAHADLSKVRQQKEEDMNIGINFYELKTQLADLGFSEPKLVDALREKTLGAEQPIFTINYREKNSNDEFRSWFEYQQNGTDGAYQMTHYESMLSVGMDDTHRLFATDISRQEALAVLYQDQKQVSHDDNELRPMTRADVRAYLGPLDTNNETLKTPNIMNTQNLEFLKKSLLNLGFGEKVNSELEKQIDKKTPEFTLNARHEFNQQKVDYTLHFKAGDTDGMYFFNKYDAAIKKGKDNKTEQTFYINKGNGITAKEAFNLMDGRAVHKQLFNKDGEKYQAWLQLDNDNLTQNGSKEIKRFNENYGFDLEQVISGKGIKEMETPEGKETLMKSLKKGNAQQITVSRNGGDTKYFIAASPQYKTVDLYDHKMKKIRREELLQPEQKQANQKQTKQQKEELPEKKQQSRKRKMTV